MKNKGLRYNTGKPRWSLVEFDALIPMVKVLEFGSRKYASHQWKKGLDKVEILECAMRHLKEMMMAEVNGDPLRHYDYDPNCKDCQKGQCTSHSGELHVGHLMCNALFYSYFNKVAPLEELIKKSKAIKKVRAVEKVKNKKSKRLRK